ncbi:hypothetical protein HMPREF1982_00385 [Clostridiales bacterium oral taxon 876 str. F0540]|nr:hypothetical protein HMPREF1982_00385 [Clostridiales bacterium oral taxon 876 str. F0540]
MYVKEFIESSIFNNLDVKSQDLLLDLFKKLESIDFIVVKRNEPTIVLKARNMFESNPKSQCNIATIRFKEGYITVGPYKNLDENIVKCKTIEDINEDLINKIIDIYNEKSLKL